jgi:hypothetical protein
LALKVFQERVFLHGVHPVQRCVAAGRFVVCAFRGAAVRSSFLGAKKE